MPPAVGGCPRDADVIGPLTKGAMATIRARGSPAGAARAEGCHARITQLQRARTAGTGGQRPRDRASGWSAAMTSGPVTRASDQDRERTAAALGEHYAAGRLTLEEFQERLDQRLRSEDPRRARRPDGGPARNRSEPAPGSARRLPAASRAARSGDSAGPWQSLRSLAHGRPRYPHDLADRRGRWRSVAAVDGSSAGRHRAEAPDRERAASTLRPSRPPDPAVTFRGRPAGGRRQRRPGP